MRRKRGKREKRKKKKEKKRKRKKKATEGKRAESLGRTFDSLRADRVLAPWLIHWLAYLQLARDTARSVTP